LSAGQKHSKTHKPQSTPSTKSTSSTLQPWRNYSINNCLHTCLIFFLTLPWWPYTLRLLQGAKRLFGLRFCRFEQLGELVWHLLWRCPSSPRNKNSAACSREQRSCDFL